MEAYGIGVGCRLSAPDPTYVTSGFLGRRIQAQ